MGWKTVVRSINAASKESQRENQKLVKQERREQEKSLKKIERIREKRVKIVDALDDLLARGDIDITQYTLLKERESKVSDDILVFGGTPGVTAAKRFITGKIDVEEFENIIKTILPPEVSTEKERVFQKIKQMEHAFQSFIKSINGEGNQACQRCGKEKGLFRPLKETGKFFLCGICRTDYENLSRFPTMNGTFFIVNEFDLSDGGSVVIQIKPEHLSS